MPTTRCNWCQDKAPGGRHGRRFHYIGMGHCCSSTRIGLHRADGSDLAADCLGLGAPPRSGYRHGNLPHARTIGRPALDRIREAEYLPCKSNADDIPADKRAITKLSQERQWPPCVDERVTFMAPFEYTRQVTHPYYQKDSGRHQPFLTTPFRMPEYSAAAIPFRWALTRNAED